MDSNEIEELHCMCQEEVVANWRVVKVTVDYKACFPNGVCVGIAPEVFKMSDDDALVVAAAVYAGCRHRLKSLAVRRQTPTVRRTACE